MEDDKPPSPPTGLKSSAKTVKTVTLNWQASTDNIGVKGYYIYRDGINVGSSLYDEYSDSGLKEGTTYKYGIRSYDASGNLSDMSREITVTTNNMSTGIGAITREFWNNINGSLSSLKTDPDFPDNPDEIDQSTVFSIPVHLGDNYGTRMVGYLCPEKSGSYTFYISSDDSGELWLSTDENEYNKTRIAYVDGYTGYGVWTKYSSQKSVPIKLTGGKRYYIEALHAEWALGDHMEVGWKVPGSSSIEIIPGKDLMPLMYIH